MYRRHMQVRVRGNEVLRFLLQDTSFPCTVHYCLAEVENCLLSPIPTRAFAKHSAAPGTACSGGTTVCLVTFTLQPRIIVSDYTLVLAAVGREEENPR